MVIQELKPSKRVKGRWLAILEDGSILRMGEGEVVGLALYAGKELSPEEVRELTASARRSGLKEKALGLLSRRPVSRRELEGKLREWEAGAEEIQEICGRMEELGYLDNAAYAARVARHWSDKGYGEKRIRDELYRRGVPRELWEDALAQVHDNSGAIDAFLEKKLGGRVPDRAELKRVSDALARRGYHWSQIDEGLRRYGIGLEFEE